MKLFYFFIFTIAFSINLNSQFELDNGQLLVKKDSTSFYSFSKKGVYNFSLINDSVVLNSYNNYSFPVPKEIQNLDLFRELKSTSNSKGEVYFLFPGGGLLFQYKNNRIERIDNSFPHRNQFSGHFFSYKGDLFVLGGYGYWKSNSLLTKFNFNSKEWNIIPTIGAPPKLGINSGDFILNNNIVYVFNFTERVDEEDIKNPDLFKLDLNSYSWEAGGTLNRLFNEDLKLNFFEQKVGVQYGKNKYFHKRYDSNVYLIVNPTKNSVKTFTNTNLSLVTRNSIIIGSKIIYTGHSGDRSSEILIMKDINKGSVLVDEGYLTNDLDLILTYSISVGVFCFLLILFTFLKFKKDTFYFVLENNAIKGLNKSLKINKDERFILEILYGAKNNEIDNSYFLNYFKNSDISNDANIKRKNKAIRDLNRKFLETFGLVVVEKIQSKKDSRESVYKISPKIIIKA